MPSKLAVQLYTVRDHIKKGPDFAESLRKIRAIGYEAVQLSAVGAMNGDSPEVDAATARRILDDHGLKCIATHRSWDQLVHQTEAEIDIHQTLGCPFAAIAGAPNMKEQTPESFRVFAKEAERLAVQLQTAGLQFGYHNHSSEFCRTERHGPTLLDIIIDETNPVLKLELDLYWIENAGVDARSILERTRGRVPVIHLKDKEVIPGTNETRMAPIGEGNMNWNAFIPACESAGVEWYAIEQDNCYRDPFDCLKSSFEFLSERGL